MASDSLRTERAVAICGLSEIRRPALPARRPVHVRLSEGVKAWSDRGVKRCTCLLSFRLRLVADWGFRYHPGVRLASAATPLCPPPHLQQESFRLAGSRRCHGDVVTGRISAGDCLRLVSRHRLLVALSLFRMPRGWFRLVADDPGDCGQGRPEIGGCVRARLCTERSKRAAGGRELVAHGATAPVI